MKMEWMVKLRKLSPCTPQEKERVAREIEPSADRAIDRLVYELYGLTEEEVKVVEGRDSAISPLMKRDANNK